MGSNVRLAATRASAEIATGGRGLMERVIMR